MKQNSNAAFDALRFGYALEIEGEICWLSLDDINDPKMGSMLLVPSGAKPLGPMTVFSITGMTRGPDGIWRKNQ